jgi:hypothetical protein
MHLIQRVTHTPGTQPLTETAAKFTNDKGRDFIKTWIKNPIVEMRFNSDPADNWFLAITEKYTYSLPHKENSASPSHFGDIAHANKYYPI